MAGKPVTCDYSLPDTPPGYELATAQACAALVNAVSRMATVWVCQEKPDQSKFENYEWTDTCPVTKERFDALGFEFGDLLWSTFDAGDGKAVSEPFAVVATSGDDAYLAFRGTKTGVDGRMDAKIAKVPYAGPDRCPAPDGAEVSEGFWAVFAGMRDAVIAALEGTRGKRLVITGHSLGSALATLAVPEAHALQLTGLHYNQASPQVGNQRFAEYVGTADNCLPPTPTIPTVRLVNTNDPVPTSPGEHLGYRHAGTAVCIENVDYGGRDGINNHNPCCSYSYAIFHPERPENPLFGRCSRWGTPA